MTLDLDRLQCAGIPPYALELVEELREARAKLQLTEHALAICKATSEALWRDHEALQERYLTVIGPIQRFRDWLNRMPDVAS